MSDEVETPAPESYSAPIAALASGQGAGAIALIRLSGSGVHELLRRCLPTEALWPDRMLRKCPLTDPATGSVVDDAMVVFFTGPRSYTGEDSAEIHCHGGAYIIQSVLALLYRLGCRPAEPGEFTRRAFLHGKLDLTAAEGIRELIDAQSHQQWVAARHLASGQLKLAIDSLRQTLVGALAFLEAQIDFPDEGDTAHLHLGMVRQRALAVQTEIERLAASYKSGRVASQGLMVALFGAPNAGKSTLMNSLLGRQRAIVTEHAGTTRDYLEERCLVHGRLLRLVDMAGIRAPGTSIDPVEALGIEAARRLAGEADLVLFLAPADSDVDPSPQIAAWRAELQPRAYLQIATKADLHQPSWSGPWLSLSCRSGEGLDALRQALADQVDTYVGGLNQEQAFVTSARHQAALQDALAALTRFFAADAAGAYEELLAFELQEAAKALVAIVGQVGNEDVLDRIFSEFCVGK
ncbi:MAG: tRNA uridine-5-carboxymethylaminomethyl(34) synthesis GTPase MnmE [Proteobacteria bacterium]|nr:tRNA uridine-5-carboxymethylaminomethyl(34) synthesis GTPase MnmE [Pseudomonadota bacterium]